MNNIYSKHTKHTSDLFSTGAKTTLSVPHKKKKNSVIKYKTTYNRNDGMDPHPTSIYKVYITKLVHCISIYDKRINTRPYI